LKVAYIAGPYRPSNGKTVLENIRHAERYAIKYWKLGYAVICPHLNTAHFDGLCPDETWLKGDLEILKRCDVIVMIPGAANSSGACKELDLALESGIQVIYEDPIFKVRKANHGWYAK